MYFVKHISIHTLMELECVTLLLRNCMFVCLYQNVRLHVCMMLQYVRTLDK